jgi:hypothetical protein
MELKMPANCRRKVKGKNSAALRFQDLSTGTKEHVAAEKTADGS